MRRLPISLLIYLQRSKMDNTVDIWMSRENFVQCGLVRHIHFVEFGSLAAEDLNAIEGNLGGIVKAVDNHHLVAMFEEGEGRERPDVSSASGRRRISICSWCGVWGVPLQI